MGRSVSYPSAAQVVTFRDNSGESCCPVCDGRGTISCEECNGTGHIDGEDIDDLIDEFQSHLARLFPSVTIADDWIDREDHVLADNKLARFGMSEYCGLVAYWIVPNEPSDGYYRVGDSDPTQEGFRRHWIKSISDKFVAAFGELTKVGSMSNGEGVYRRIDK